MEKIKIIESITYGEEKRRKEKTRKGKGNILLELY
jgi:hypothetical protein